MTNDTTNTPSSATDNATSSSNDDLENIADIEKYFLRSKGEIIQKLRLLAKSKSSITGYFSNGNEFFLTAIIDVLRDKNVIVLDISRDQELNKKITQSKRIVFKTKHLGVTAQFNIDSIQTAKFQNRQFFACEIPSDILWVQRRNDFRVQIPMSNHATCQVKNDAGELNKYRIIDVSGGGIAIADEKFALKVEAGEEFKDASLIFNNELSCTANLTIQNTLPLNFASPGAGQRIGCSFQFLQADFAADLQRYINQLDNQYRQTSPS